jgi:hypothetical protein
MVWLFELRDFAQFFFATHRWCAHVTIGKIEASRWWEKDKDELKAFIRSQPNFAFSPGGA